MGPKSPLSLGSSSPLHPTEQVLLRERIARIARPALDPKFCRVPEQLLDHGGDGFVTRVIQEGFVLARKENPLLTTEQYIARVAPTSQLGRVLTEALGSESFRLLRANNRAEFESALEQLFRHFHAYEPPYDAGLSYPVHRYLDDTHIDLRGSKLLVLPINSPYYSTSAGKLLYPMWDTHGRLRANRSIGAIQALRIWGRHIPLDKSGKELFDALDDGDWFETFVHYLDPELQQTKLQTAFTLSTGNSPIYRSVLSTNPKEKFTGLQFFVDRNEQQARWELAARLGSQMLDPHTDLRAQRNALTERSLSASPSTPVKNDAFTHATLDQLFKMALREPDSPRVLLNTFEWEHHRSQRFYKQLNNLITGLNLDDAWRSKTAMLTGLCEPENLHFLPPWMHAREDFFAGGLTHEWDKVWVAGEFKTEAFRANTSRMDRWGNLVVNPDFSKHRDLERVKDVLVSYEPRHVIQLQTQLLQPEVGLATQSLSKSNRNAWNKLADQLNKAAEVYGITPALRLQKLAP